MALKKPLANLLLLAVVGIMILVIAEYGLRFLGYQPATQFFRAVDTLEVFDHYYTDEDGIFKANPASAHWAGKISINNSGFRSPMFDTETDGRCSILLLGDSMAWGMSAEPLTRSYPDLLRGKGFAVYNTGIPGTSPTQYKRIAEKYIPALKPDIVLVSFTMENDLLIVPEDLQPNQNLWHITNAGWILARDEAGQYLEPQSAYDHYIGGTYATLKRLAYQSVIGTMAISALKKLRDDYLRPLSTGGAAKTEADTTVSPPDLFGYSFRVLEEISTIASSNDAEFAVLVIPNHAEGCGDPTITAVAQYRTVFDKLNPVYLDEIPKEVYIKNPDCHLDNDGHLYVSEVLAQRFAQCW